MRGLYSAVYLSALANRYAERRGIGNLDIGKGFNLITGTSTGAIIACALAADVPPDRIVELYRKWGPSIFPRKLPQKLGVDLVRHIWKGPQYLRAGAIALKKALVAELGETTLGEVWENREIALAIPAVEMSHHRAWVFKTPHLPNSHHRDDKYRLVDVCLATTAAPIYRSMARLETPDSLSHHVFVDGGLWANNPVLVGLIDALEVTTTEDRIEIYCLGTCPRPGGELIGPEDLNRGLSGWQFGGGAVSLSLDAQGFVFNEMARMLSHHVERECQIVHFPHGTVPANFMGYLGLDETDNVAMDALVAQAQADVNETLSCCRNTADCRGQLLHALFNGLSPTVGAANESTVTSFEKNAQED